MDVLRQESEPKVTRGENGVSTVVTEFILSLSKGSALSKDPILAVIGEEGEEGMEDGAEEKGAPGSLVDLKRNLYPSKPRADLKKN